MSRVKKILDSENAHVLTLRVIIVILVFFCWYAMSGWREAPEHIKIDIPPDLRTGSTRGINERHPFNLYSFGLYIFQQLNNWPKNGVKDYKMQSHNLQCYFTPRFRAEIERDYERKNKLHELARTRALQEIPGRPYAPNRIYKESEESWIAYYDTNIKETFRGEVIKDIFIRYPLRIIKYDVDPECNLWGLAIDGFFKDPVRLEKAAPLEGEKK